MLTKPAATIGGEGRGMDGLEDEIALAINHIGLRTGIAAPEHVDQMFALRGQCTDGSIGERLPPQRGMAVGLMGPDGQRGVEQQYTLFSPARQVAREWYGRAEVLLNFLEDVLQRGRKLDAVLHREAESVSLTRLMVGILSDDDHLDLVEGTKVEGVEDERTWRIACRRPIFLTDSSSELSEVRFVELTLQVRFPRGFYLYIHNLSQFCCKDRKKIVSLQAKSKDMFAFWKKKDKYGYPHSFAKRLTWRIMLRMLIIMGIPTFLVFWFGSGMVEVGAEALSNRLVKGEYEEIRRITSDVYVASVNTAPVIEENLNQPDKMIAIMKRMLETNPRIRSCGISFVEGYYPQKGRWYCPYAVRRDSATVETQILGDKDNDYLNAGWFKEALSRDEGYWGKAFFDSKDKETPLVSYNMPIHDKQNKTVAILGVDLSLDWLNNRVQVFSRKGSNDSLSIVIDNDSTDGNWEAQYNMYFFLADSTGTLLIHPDKKRIVNEKLQSYVTKDPDSITQKILGLKSGQTEENDYVLEDEDVFITYKPIKYTSWTLGLVIPTLFIKVFGYVIGGMMIAMILIGLLVVYFFGRRVIKKAVKPLKQLAVSANEVAKGNFDTPLPALKSRDEVHLLRDSFEQMEKSLTNYVEELKTTTAQKASIESELKVAHDIQMSMLPKTFPPFPERSDIDVYGTLTPAKGVGGDLFDFYIRDEKLFFCIGDVSGKGIPAALIMAVTRSLFRNISSYASQPSAIVYALNNALSEGNDNNMFVTLFVGVFDLQTGMLQYCNAGHDSPLLVGRDVGVLPCQSNLPVGVIYDFKYSQQEARIDPETTVFLFTDGLNEAENISHAQFGDMRIQNVAKRVLAKGEHQPINIIYEMSEAVRAFVGEAEQSDDLTMLAIQYKV